MPVKPVYRDPFSPLLLSADTKALTLSQEQDDYIREVLSTACSDSKFAQKAYDAIQFILTSGAVKVPIVTSLVPNSAELGSPSFTLHVHGTNLVAGSVINFAGFDEPTTHVSDSELTTGVDMSVWLGADVLPVIVSSPSGAFSTPLSFTFVAPGTATLSAPGTLSADGTHKVIKVPSVNQPVPSTHTGHPSISGEK